MVGGGGVACDASFLNRKKQEVAKKEAEEEREGGEYERDERGKGVWRSLQRRRYHRQRQAPRLAAVRTRQCPFPARVPLVLQRPALGRRGTQRTSGFHPFFSRVREVARVCPRESVRRVMGGVRINELGEDYHNIGPPAKNTSDSKRKAAKALARADLEHTGQYIPIRP